MIGDAFTIGILPQQLYDMTLREFSLCMKAYNKKHEQETRCNLYLCWLTANFTGHAFAGKLKPFKQCVSDDAVAPAPKISKEEFDRRLSQAKGGE